MQQLTPIQHIVMDALVAGSSVSAAAIAAGLHRTTIHHWSRTNPDFRFALDTAKITRAEAIRDEMAGLSHLALSSLRKLLEDPATQDNIRLKAALAVINSATQVDKQSPAPPPPLPEEVMNCDESDEIETPVEDVAAEPDPEIDETGTDDDVEDGEEVEDDEADELDRSELDLLCPYPGLSGEKRRHIIARLRKRGIIPPRE